MNPLLSGNALLALAAALLWGGGDFAGGMGVKHAGGKLSGALRVVLYGHLASLSLLLIYDLVTKQMLPHGTAVLWAMSGGVATGLALCAFYLALSSGAMGSAAAVSGLLSAAVPAAVSSAIEGRPSALRLAGFALAACAIWLIASQSNAATSDRRAIFMAAASGLGFGYYFVALRMANSLGIVMPMTVARTASAATAALLLVALTLSAKRRGVAMQWSATAPVLRWALTGAMLDLCGNLFFIAATRAGRLDVAAVLASLYPASTIVLAGWLLHERLTARQWAGMGVAVGAVVMISV